MIDKIKHIHFIGIGGVGMSALALVLLKRGFDVSGSDISNGAIQAHLASEGAIVFIGHDPCQLRDAEAVVVSSAIKEENPELIEAKKRGIAVYHRSDILAYLLNDVKGIAVAGAHGKTTTSSMLACICNDCNVDPTIIIGGMVNKLNGNARNGKSDILVAEADESDGSFLKFTPYIAIVTNIEDDHLDHYGTIENIYQAFKMFSNNVKIGGKAVLCVDNKTVARLSKETKTSFVTYGIKNELADYFAKNIEFSIGKTTYDLYYKGKFISKVMIQLPGLYNVLNSMAAIIAASIVDIPLKEIIKSLANFEGTKRRFETKGKINSVWVVDDYAHHPTEIKAVLKAAKDTNPKKCICIFQPHRYSRTKLLLEEFANAFVDCDELILADIYAASEKPIEGIDSELLAAKIQELTGKKVKCIASFDLIRDYILKAVEPGYLVMTVGAGNVYQIGEMCIKALKERYSNEEC